MNMKPLGCYVKGRYNSDTQDPPECAEPRDPNLRRADDHRIGTVESEEASRQPGSQAGTRVSLLFMAWSKA